MPKVTVANQKTAVRKIVLQNFFLLSPFLRPTRTWNQLLVIENVRSVLVKIVRLHTYVFQRGAVIHKELPGALLLLTEQSNWEILIDWLLQFPSFVYAC